MHSLHQRVFKLQINSNNQLPKCIIPILLNYFAAIDGRSPAPNGTTGPSQCA